MSTTVAPARAPVRTPSGPNITCSSAASFVTLETTMPTPAASCLDVAATFAPRCCKASVLSWVRSSPTTSWWAASNRPAMRLPIAPTPIKPTRIVSPQPLWILVCPIEMMGRLVELVLSVACGERGPAEQRDGKYELYKTTDRKSTRLNSSHLVISYAVFCLKKKKNKQ